MKNIDLHDIQESIMEKLGYRNRMRFSDLQGNESSNKISFHLNKLQENKLIEKKDNKYSTTAKGKEYLAYIEQQQLRQPLIINHVLIFSGDSVYLNRRDDALDPFPGSYRGLVLRTEKDESIQRSAEEAYSKEFGEESPEADIRGVMRNNIHLSGGFEQHYISFFTVIETSKDKEENFHDLENLESLEIIPGLDKLILKSRDEDERFFGEWTISETDKDSFELSHIEFE